MTNRERAMRGFTTDTDCSCCSGYTEDLDHVFRKCLKAQQSSHTLVGELQQEVSKIFPSRTGLYIT